MLSSFICCSAAFLCALSFLLSSLGGITRFVDLQMSGFSSFPQILAAQVLVGAMGNTPPIWVVIGLGTFLLLFCLAGFCTFACGALAGNLHLYARTTLLHRFAFWARAFAILSRTLSVHPITTQKQGIRLSFFTFEFFIEQKISIAFGRGESECMTYRLDYAPTAMDSPIFTSFGHFAS